jgi:uncharacterized protein (TIGR02646 family)
MIRVKRPNAIPAVLQTRGVAATTQLCADYAAAPADYADGTKQFDFDRTIYAHDEVKTALRQAQYDKCCFCEAFVTHICPGDIEHFRPKAAVCQRSGGPLQRPGYYWLVYDWQNRLFCCEKCNREGKGNLFPLRRVRRRATSPQHNLAAEEPLLLNPAEDEPSHYLRFSGEFVFPVRKSRRGQVTIDVLGLNRPELASLRRKHLVWLTELVECRRLFLTAIREAEAADKEPPPGYQEKVASFDVLFADLSSDSAEYAAMVRAALR